MPRSKADGLSLAAATGLNTAIKALSLPIVEVHNYLTGVDPPKCFATRSAGLARIMKAVQNLTPAVEARARCAREHARLGDAYAIALLRASTEAKDPAEGVPVEIILQ